MPEILLPPAVLRKFPGNGGRNFPICPGFYSRRQFSGIFWAVVAVFFLYARVFPHAGSSQEISGQWREVFLYMPKTGVHSKRLAQQKIFITSAVPTFFRFILDILSLLPQHRELPSRRLRSSP